MNISNQQKLRPTDRMTIGQLAGRTGLTTSAIRYYEAEGLVLPFRNSGGQRRFLRSDIRRMSFIVITQQFGLTITDIKALLQNLPLERTPNKRDWEKIAKKFRKHLDAKIDTLNQLRDQLDGCIGCGCLSMAKCKLYNPDDEAVRFGKGPRFLMGDRPK